MINNNIHILVIDDNLNNLKVVSNLLKELNYKIALATDVKNAFNILHEYKIDLILLDVMMPDMDGFQACELIKSEARFKEIPVIFLTALNEPKDIVNGFNKGGVDYITKPFIKEELLARVNNQIQLKENKEKLSENIQKLSEALHLSDKLLLNILPEDVAKDFKCHGYSPPKNYDNVTLFVSDFVQFTKISSQLSSSELFNELNEMYSAFDKIMGLHRCERIKTIGDAYLAICGMPQQNPNHAINIVNASIEILEYIKNRNKHSKIKWELRIGIHSGEVTGGIVGVDKYIYDIFGSAVNTVFRMENASEPMQINISESTFKFIQDKVGFIERKEIPVKGLEQMKMYFIKQ